MGQSTYVRYGQCAYLLEAACKCPLKGMPWLEITPRNYSGFLIYYLNSNIREFSRILESGKFLPVEFGIRKKNSWGIQNLGLWNPESH